MGILSLPVELLHTVLDYTQPYDFESLVLSSKRLYGVAKPKIAEHNKQRKRYRDFKFNEKAGPRSIQSVPQLLMEIALYPSIANYIYHISLQHRKPLDEVLQQDKDKEITRWMKANSVALYRLLKQSSYLSALGNGDDYINEWLKRIMDETTDFDQHVDYATAFLFTLLPNLKTLLLSKYWSHFSTCESNAWQEREISEFDRRVRDLVQVIITRANDTSRSGQSLARLHTIYPVYNEDARYTQSGTDMLAIVPLMALDSLCVVHDDAGFCEVEERPKQGAVENKRTTKELSAELDNEDATSHSSEEASMDDGSGVEDRDNLDNDQEQARDNDQYGDDHYDEGSWGDRNIDSDDDDDDAESESDIDGYADLSCLDNEVISTRYPVLGRNIEKMHLQDYVIGGVACGVLFRHMKNLRYLHMDYCMKDEYGTDWDVGRFIYYLGCTVGTTLERLELSCGMIYEFEGLIRNSMDDYKVLRELILDMSFFTGSGGMNHDEAHGEYDDESGRIVPLIRILPKSLEMLHLAVVSIDHVHFPRLFRNFSAKRETKLPYLKKATLCINEENHVGEMYPDHEFARASIELFAFENGLEVIGH